MSLILSGTDGLSDVDGSAATPAIRGTDANTGIFFPSADTIAFSEGGTESMRIDSSGNVGIGTSSPDGKLKVVASGANLIIGFSGTQNYFDASENIFRNFAGTERMRITSTGQLLVGATSSSAQFYVNGNSASSFGSYITCNINGGAATAVNAENPCSTHVQWYNSGTPTGSVTWNGASAVAYNTTSDYRLKESIAPMTGALDKVSQLKPCTYKWKLDGADGQGFIAHELAEVVPDCVSGEKDAVNEDGSIKPQGIDTSFLVATLTAAIQELNAKVEAQAIEIAELKAK